MAFIRMFLVVLTFVWATLYFLGAFTQGAWWMIIPLAGVFISLQIVWRTLKFLVKNRKGLRMLFNALHNVLFLIEARDLENSPKFQEMLSELVLPKEEFERRNR